MLEQPVVKFIDDDNLILMEDYTFEWSKGFGKIKRTYEITAYKGFVYDMASVPWLGRLFIDRHGLIGGPATIHDLIYVARGIFPHKYGHFRQKIGDDWVDVPTPIKRKLADKMFLRMMKAAKIWVLKRQAAYRIVRAGGWVYWNT
jgi:hypothetical protein